MNSMMMEGQVGREELVEKAVPLGDKNKKSDTTKLTVNILTTTTQQMYIYIYI